MVLLVNVTSLLGLLFLVAIPLSAHGTDEFGQAFLAENKNKEGVVTLPSGLQYKVLREGDGDEHPLAATSCECHYEGRTAQEYPNGDTFDSSYARGSPTSFAPNQVIKGWTEAMQLMVEGDKWEMYIPSELGYGESGSPPKIGGGNVLVFTMEILKINGATRPAERGPPPYGTLTNLPEFDDFAAGPGVKVLAGFKKGSGNAPVVGKLFSAFKAAARAGTKAGSGSTFAHYVHKAFDGKQYADSALAAAVAAKHTAGEPYPKLTAPNVYTLGPKTGGKWKKCKTGVKLAESTVGDISGSILKCVDKAAGKKSKKKKKEEAAAAKAEKTAEEL